MKLLKNIKEDYVNRMKAKILEMLTDITNHEKALMTVLNWTNNKSGKYVCVSNVHMCMEAFDNQEYSSIINNADLTVPDGKPLVWAQKLLEHKEASHVRGTDLTLELCKEAEKKRIPIGLYGGSQDALDNFNVFLKKKFPDLKTAYSFSPPFRPLTKKEDDLYTAQINESGAKILFVGLGCPKQEIWMAEHKNRVNCVMIGVGAAFDFLSGDKKEAPKWMQNIGIEWVFRLASEPDRLWKRYLKHNPRFVVLFIKQLMIERFGKGLSVKSPLNWE